MQQVVNGKKYVVTQEFNNGIGINYPDSCLVGVEQDICFYEIFFSQADVIDS